MKHTFQDGLVGYKQFVESAVEWRKDCHDKLVLAEAYWQAHQRPFWNSMRAVSSAAAVVESIVAVQQLADKT